MKSNLVSTKCIACGVEILTSKDNEEKYCDTCYDELQDRLSNTTHGKAVELKRILSKLFYSLCEFFKIDVLADKMNNLLKRIFK